jgi:hypothetical protein
MFEGGSNELSNPNFATNTDHWFSLVTGSGAGSFTRATGDSDFGVCGQLAITGATTGDDGMMYTDAAHWIPVRPGETVFVSIKQKITTGTGSSLQLHARWMTPSGGFLSETEVATVTNPTTFFVYPMEGSQVAPEGAGLVGIAAKAFLASGTALTYRIDDANLVIDKNHPLVNVELAPSNSGAGVITAMSQTSLTGGKWDLEFTGTRIQRVLDEIGYTGAATLDDGEAQVVAQGFSLKQNVSALAHIQEVADSELGYVFIAGDGTFTYHDGAHRAVDDRSTVPQVMINDGTNQLVNPSFELDTTWEFSDVYLWNAFVDSGSASIARVADSSFGAGAFAAEVTVTGAASSDDTVAFTPANTNLVQAREGDTVTASCQIKKVSGSMSSLYLKLTWEDESFVGVSSDTVDTQSSPSDGTIYTLEGSAVAPAGARWVKIGIGGVMSGASAVYRVDDAELIGSYQRCQEIQMVSLDKDKIANRINVTAGTEGAVPQTYDDPDSQTAYGVRVLDRQTRLAEISDAQAQALALLSAFKDPHVYVESITLLDDGTPEWAEDVLAREIGDRITIRFSPPVADAGDAYQFEQDCFIEAISDDFQPGQPLRVTFQLSSVDQNPAIPQATDKS